MSQHSHKLAGPVSTPTVARPRHLPATGMPAAREDRRGWGLLSFLLHALIIVLLLTDFSRLHTGNVIEKPQGAGGPGPAGGGGGGHRGTGGIQEHVRYVKVVQAPPPTPTEKPVVTPPPVVKPPVVPPPPPRSSQSR